jgi:hypothetical protein
MVGQQNVITQESAESVLRTRAARQAGFMIVLFELIGWALVLCLSQRALAQTDRYLGNGVWTLPTLVIGFTGGFVHSDDLRHSEAQLAKHVEQNDGDRVIVGMFENRQRAQARSMILDWIGRLKSAGLLEDGVQPRIILFGHSWGASAVVYLARDLEKDGVPVAFTVQVDSIKKHGEDDSVIPANIAEAVNFYQVGGMLHGQPDIKAVDPSRTRILGNYRFNYAHEPADCHAYPWRDRFFFKGHTAIECDPQVWSQVETLIEDRLPHDRASAHDELAQTK